MKGLLLFFLTFPMYLMAQTVSNTYSAGDIPTSLPPFNPTCNGPVTTLSVDLPAGGPWVVTGIDIVYDMLAQSTGWKSHQRSQVYCQNTDRIESSVYSGTGDENGVQNYSRTGVSIANSIYAGGTELIFEMRAWRTTEGIGCNTTYNRVNNFTWEITVYYTTYTESGSVGIGTSLPDSSALIDLSSATKGFLPPRMNTGLRLAIEEPATGLVVYDTDVDKLYCYSGSSWVQIISDFTTLIRDADNDTKIQVEASTDEDIIRFDVGGTERWRMEGLRLVPDAIFIGENAGLNSLNTGYNMAIGYASLQYNILGEHNLAIGFQSLISTSGDRNIGIGNFSMFNNESSNNIGIGFSVMGSNTSGHHNTCIGNNALDENETGSYNVAVGFESGTGSVSDVYQQCTFVGASSSPTEPRTNVTMLGFGITNSLCTGDDQILLGNTAVSAIRAQVTSITSYSDARYKTNITEDIKGLDFIKRLRPVSYNVRPTELHKIWGTPDSLYQRIDHSGIEQMRFSGFLAQEVEQAAAECNYSFTGIEVPRNEKETYSLRYTEFIIPMVKGMQEQQEMIERLQEKNEELAKSNMTLENKYLLLEERLNQLIASVASLQK